jgi:hypothetical protein
MLIDTMAQNMQPSSPVSRARYAQTEPSQKIIKIATINAKSCQS